MVMSKYDDILVELDLYVRVAAKEFVPKLYAALREEGISPEDSRERIEKDCFRIWKPKTIRDQLPDEAKAMAMARPENKNAEKIIDTEGRAINEELVSVPRREFDALKAKLQEYSVKDTVVAGEVMIPNQQLKLMLAMMQSAIDSGENIYIKHQDNHYIRMRRAKN